jgi:hypothetical protein
MHQLTTFSCALALASLAALPTSATAEPNNPQQACWGQATKVFAQTGAMGRHASEQPSPRLGLRNLARALFEAGVIPDDSMYSLGVFVATELGLEIDACMNMP